MLVYHKNPVSLETWHARKEKIGQVPLKILLKGVNLTTFHVKIHNFCVLISEVSSSNSNILDVFMWGNLWALFVSETPQLYIDQHPINKGQRTDIHVDFKRVGLLFRVI